MDKQLMLDGMIHLKEIFVRLGIHRVPTWEEVDTYIKWTSEWNITHEAILYACKYTVSGSPRVSYLNGILNNLKRTDGESTTVADLIAREQLCEEYKKVCRQAKGKTRITNEALETFKKLRQEYPLDLIELAAQEAESKTVDLNKIRYCLESWKKKGLTNAEEAFENITDYKKRASLINQIYKELNLKPLQTRRNHALVYMWEKTGFTDDVILYVAGLAAHADIPFVYMDSILRKAQMKGLWTVEEIEKESFRNQ